METNGATLWWNSFDIHIELYLNHFVGRHPWFDSMVSWSDATPLAKGGVIVLLLWLVLFDHQRPGQLRKGFEPLIGAFVLSALAAATARGLALILPFRTRPLATPSLHFQLPAGATLEHIDWSSFPSDHAALFFSLATGILMVSFRAGWLAVAWAALVVCLPRPYLGQHWPTDILVGALIGVLTTQLVRVPAIREFIRRSTLNWQQSHPAIFFAVLFLWSYEIVNLFGDIRHLMKLAVHSI